ncbi:MAG: alpha/beta fold hydrolase [Candidatus Saccharimonadaceae bacterium]
MTYNRMVNNDITSARPNRRTVSKPISAQTKPAVRSTTKPLVKPTLIMIHGFRGTHHGLLLIAKALKGFNIIIPDLPGFGRGPKLATYDLDSYVDWLHGFIEKQGLTRRPYLMGHSFGTIVCAAYAKKYPKSIQRLILVNPIGAPALEGPKKVMSKLAILYYKVGAKLPEKPAHAWLSSKAIVRVMSVTMAKTKDKGLRTYIHHQHDRYFSRFHNPTSLLESFTTSVSHHVGEFAKDIPVRTLLIAGTLDDITPLSVQYGLAKKFPQAKLKVIDNVGHLTHYETPERVAELIQAFIKSV